MQNDNFYKAKQYLSRLRKWAYEIEPVSDTHIRITVKNRYATKSFEAVYEDFDSEYHAFANNLRPRSTEYHYWLSFWQTDVGMGDGSLGEVHEEKWFETEENLIQRKPNQDT